MSTTYFIALQVLWYASTHCESASKHKSLRMTDRGMFFQLRPFFASKVGLRSKLLNTLNYLVAAKFKF